MAQVRALPLTLRTALALSLALAAVLALRDVSPAAAAPPPYYPSGPQTNVDESELDGWQICYQSTYDTRFDEPANDLDTVFRNCDGEYLLLAGRPVGSTVFDVLAAAPREDVIFDTGTGDTPHNANGSGWYFNGSWSWGFAPEGAEIDRSECDIIDSSFTGGDTGGTGAYRLCWHTWDGAIDNGWRSGLNDQLNDSAAFERFIYEADEAVASGGIDAFGVEFASVFFVLAHLELGENSDGLQPTSEEVALFLGGNKVVFPAGSLDGTSFFATGATIYDGIVAQVWLIQMFPGRYLMIAFGHGVDEFDSEAIGITVGDDEFLPPI